MEVGEVTHEPWEYAGPKKKHGFSGMARCYIVRYRNGEGPGARRPGVRGAALDAVESWIDDLRHVLGKSYRAEDKALLEPSDGYSSSPEGATLATAITEGDREAVKRRLRRWRRWRWSRHAGAMRVSLDDIKGERTGLTASSPEGSIDGGEEKKEEQPSGAPRKLHAPLPGGGGLSPGDGYVKEHLGRDRRWSFADASLSPTPDPQPHRHHHTHVHSHTENHQRIHIPDNPDTQYRQGDPAARRHHRRGSLPHRRRHSAFSPSGVYFGAQFALTGSEGAETEDWNDDWNQGKSR